MSERKLVRARPKAVEGTGVMSKAADPVAEMALELTTLAKQFWIDYDTPNKPGPFTLLNRALIESYNLGLRRLGASGVDVEGLARIAENMPEHDATCCGRYGCACEPVGKKIAIEIRKHIAQPAAPEILAQRFHEAYERLAPRFDYVTRLGSAKPWAEIPENNKRLMIAVCKELFG